MKPECWIEAGKHILSAIQALKPLVMDDDSDWEEEGEDADNLRSELSDILHDYRHKIPEDLFDLDAEIKKRLNRLNSQRRDA